MDDVWKALILDDDEALAARFAAIFGEDGLRVRIATNLGDALWALAGAPDVVVANIHLRAAAAADVLRVIRERDADVPVVFVEAWPPIPSDEAGALRGAVVTAARQRVHRRSRRRSVHPDGVIFRG